MTPGQGHFRPQRHNLNKLGRGLLDNATCQISSPSPYGFWQVDFLCFPYNISIYETCNPWAGLLLTKEHNLNKLGRSFLADDTYQISRLYALWFQKVIQLHLAGWGSYCPLLNKLMTNLTPPPDRDPCRVSETIWAMAWDLQQFGMCDQQRLRPACAYAQTDQSPCWSLKIFFDC